MTKKEQGENPGSDGTFHTTHWSVVLAAGAEDSPRSIAALEELCQAYWYPLYAYARRQGKGREDAEDLTQQFFCRLLEKNHLARADRERGKFRTFLLASMKNFLVNEWKRAGRLKRGGGQSFVSFEFEGAETRYAAQPIAEQPAEALYEQQWAVALIERVLAVLREEYAATGKAALFEEIKGFVWGERSLASYAEAGKRLKVAEGTVKVAMHRLRRRFRELLRAEVAQTVSREDEIEGELRHLISVVS